MLASLHHTVNRDDASQAQVQGKETMSTMLESNLVPKGSPAARLRQIFMLLRLRMSPYAYAYRTCKHPCTYACVVHVNQA